MTVEQDGDRLQVPCRSDVCDRGIFIGSRSPCCRILSCTVTVVDSEYLTGRRTSDFDAETNGKLCAVRRQKRVNSFRLTAAPARKLRQAEGFRRDRA